MVTVAPGMVVRIALLAVGGYLVAVTFGMVAKAGADIDADGYRLHRVRHRAGPQREDQREAREQGKETVHAVDF